MSNLKDTSIPDSASNLTEVVVQYLSTGLLGCKLQPAQYKDILDEETVLALNDLCRAYERIRIRAIRIEKLNLS